MPRYSISNAPTEIAVCQLDPAEIGGGQGIYTDNHILYGMRYRLTHPLNCHGGDLM